MTAMLTEEQFNRLPKAAQYEIAQLRRDLKDLQAALSAGPETGAIRVQHGIDASTTQWLTPSARVSFVLGRTEYGDRLLHARVVDGKLLGLHTNGGALIVRPQVSNAIHLQIEED